MRDAPPGNAATLTGFEIDRTDQFFCGVQGRGRGAPSDPRGSQVAPTNVCDRSVRPLIKYCRSDHPVPSESSVEEKATVLEKKKSPRPILRSIGPTNFFAECKVGGRGVTDFFGGRGGDPPSCDVK